MAAEGTTPNPQSDRDDIPEGFVRYGEGACSSSVEMSDHAMQMDRIAQHASQQAVKRHQAILKKAEENKKAARSK
jgi:hypothetical protein